MQAQITPWDSSKAIGITFTDKPVIAFEGLALFVAFAQRIGLVPKLAGALSFVLAFQPFAPGLEVSELQFQGRRWACARLADPYPCLLQVKVARHGTIDQTGKFWII